MYCGKESFTRLQEISKQSYGWLTCKQSQMVYTEFNKQATNLMPQSEYNSQKGDWSVTCVICK